MLSNLEGSQEETVLGSLQIGYSTHHDSLRWISKTS